MTLRKIALMGHPLLWRRAQPVATPLDAETRRLADDMVETMRDAPGVGLAAPQVHASLRLIVVQPAREADTAMVLVNPELEPIGEVVELGLEGCLSIPDWQGLVPRWRAVRYRAETADGRPLEGEAEGFFARVLQHEVDHLDGVLYPMRLRDPRDLAMTREARHLVARLESYRADNDLEEDTRS
ncbi:MAG: peptide deformylase [Alphaproteobacteria bacterium]